MVRTTRSQHTQKVQGLAGCIIAREQSETTRHNTIMAQLCRDVRQHTATVDQPMKLPSLTISSPATSQRAGRRLQSQLQNSTYMYRQ